MKWDELEKSGDESDIGGMTGEQSAPKPFFLKLRLTARQ
jgi:hypothetical protein